MKLCPICEKPSKTENHPFCSPRCADVDLHRWVNESYRVPVKDADEDEDGDSPYETPQKPRSGEDDEA